MSRRRLYFTDTWIGYICGKEVCCDDGCVVSPGTLTYSLRSLVKTLPSSYSEIDLVTGLIEEYTRRKLSFDSDALNAIVGILNTLSMTKRPIFHTWGVTFGETPLAIALN